MPRKSRNNDLVLAQLQGCGRAMTAYELLDSLRGEGFSAPTTVYRALSRLVESGDAHRIESLNAYAACPKGHCSDPILAVCDQCRRVAEIESEKAIQGVEAAPDGFEIHHAVVELHGLCEACRDSAAETPIDNARGGPTP